MMPNNSTDESRSIAAALRACLDAQRQAGRRDPNPDYRRRRQSLLALKRMVLDNREQLIEAINRDYGNRSRHETLIAEILYVLDGIG